MTRMQVFCRQSAQPRRVLPSIVALSRSALLPRSCRCSPAPPICSPACEVQQYYNSGLIFRAAVAGSCPSCACSESLPMRCVWNLVQLSSQGSSRPAGCASGGYGQGLGVSARDSGVLICGGPQESLLDRRRTPATTAARGVQSLHLGLIHPRVRF